MSNLGLGVMIRMLSNHRSDETISRFIGKTITKLDLVDNELRMMFGDVGMALRDNGQSCCETRYMVCDDDLTHFVGSQFVGVELRDVTEESGDLDAVKECQFLIVKTTIGDFTCANYNEHNGYYGGFSIEARTIGGEGK